jgi:hypothetical protein
MKKSDDICSICHNNINNKNIVITDCNHTFHFSCIVKNIKLNLTSGNKCPICRKSFFNCNVYQSHNSITNNTRPVPDNAIINRLYQSRNISQPTINYRVPVRRSLFIGRENTNINRTSRIKKEVKLFIERLNFNQLKDKLKQHRQSSRGYLRTSLEKRLFNKLLQEKLNNNNYIM